MMKLDAMHVLRLTYISFMLELIFHSWIGHVCETFSYVKGQGPSCSSFDSKEIGTTFFGCREHLLIDPKEHPMLLVEPSTNSETKNGKAILSFFIFGIASCIWFCTVLGTESSFLQEKENLSRFIALVLKATYINHS